jgi:hypothetical protein
MNIDDTDSESDEDGDPGSPWLNEWTTYLNSNEVIPEGMGMVQWWGVRVFFLLRQVGLAPTPSIDPWPTLPDLAIPCA